jgi:photoactive yellow protein
MTFDDPGILEDLELLTPAAMDAENFGIIVMSGSGKVEAYNAFEASMAGLSPSRVVGLNFFSDVAPCTNNYMVAGRYEAEADLDEIIPYVFTLRMKPKRVHLRLLKSPKARFSYLLVRPE